MRRLAVGVLTAGTLVVSALPSTAAVQTAQPATVEEAREYVVLYTEGASPEAAHAAIAAAGGSVVRENAAIGVATVTSANAGFVLDAAAQTALDGAAANRPVGQVAPLERLKEAYVERLAGEAAQAAHAAPQAVDGDPLSGLQWGNQVVNATPQGSYAVQPGDERVRVGIIDTGIDGSHPDIAPNFDAALSRNFTVDIPEVDGPCEEEPDQSCEDPADVDENQHGTHVAGIVAAPLNGLGTAGVAPGVTLVNLRAGQDSGYFFLQPSVDAITYAADNGIDVVNMSFYIDPWLYNCPDNPADAPEAQVEQQTIIAATQRALRYAHDHNVTLVAGTGNSDDDLGNPETDTTSPDFPEGAAYPREVDNSCLSLPTEGAHVISVTAVGPSLRKAYYSSYGVAEAQLAAPGGDFNDYPGTPQYRNVNNLILAPYPAALAAEREEIDANGNPTTPFVVENCANGTCAYYTYLQGTSMSSPYAAGVASLVVSEYGRRALRGGGLTLNPDRVERILEATATDTPCPEPRLQTYITGATPAYNPTYDAYCEGTPAFNGFYGEGIVDALAAVTSGRNPGN